MTCHLPMQFGCCSRAFGAVTPCNFSSEECPTSMPAQVLERGAAVTTLHSTIGILISLVFAADWSLDWYSSLNTS